MRFFSYSIHGEFNVSGLCIWRSLPYAGFWFSNWYHSTLKSLYKLRLAEHNNWLYTWITIKIWFLFCYSHFIYSLSQCWSSPVAGEECGRKACLSLSIFKLLFINCSALSWVQPEIHCPVLDRNSGRHSNSFAYIFINCLTTNIHITSLSV